MFNRVCKACTCKDQTISFLEQQNKFLQTLVAPAPLPVLEQLEADAILSGNQDTILIDETPQGLEDDDEPSAELVERERDALLSGTY